MIDESKIKEAANAFLEKTREAYTWDCGIVSYPTEIKETENEIKDDFIAGAQWVQEEFLKTLWHDASEEPQGYAEWLIIKYEVGNFISTMQVRDIVDWRSFAEKSPAFHWCYLSDILPKEGGEQ